MKIESKMMVQYPLMNVNDYENNFYMLDGKNNNTKNKINKNYVTLQQHQQ